MSLFTQRKIMAIQEVNHRMRQLEQNRRPKRILLENHDHAQLNEAVAYHIAIKVNRGVAVVHAIAVHVAVHVAVQLEVEVVPVALDHAIGPIAVHVEGHVAEVVQLDLGPKVMRPDDPEDHVHRHQTEVVEA